MPFIVYAAILIATIFGVALEWDSLVEPSAATRSAMHALSHPQPPVAVATPNAPRPGESAQAAAPPAAAPPEQAAVTERPAPQCDVDACAAAYRTFRASDCTYNSSTGRRLCTKGEAADDSAAANASAQPVAANCHVRACAEHYSSFNPSDCTYQPLEGPRRLCTK
jgi:hypothetical protein